MKWERKAKRPIFSRKKKKRAESFVLLSKRIIFAPLFVRCARGGVPPASKSKRLIH